MPPDCEEVCAARAASADTSLEAPLQLLHAMPSTCPFQLPVASQPWLWRRLQTPRILKTRHGCRRPVPRSIDAQRL